MELEISLEKWADENLLDGDWEVHLLDKNIKNSEQMHLAVFYSSGLYSYLIGARREMAKKAIEKGCFCVIDCPDCQNKISKGTGIFVGTGMREESHPDNPVKLRMTHISKNKFLRRIGENPRNYETINLHIKYQGKPEEDYLDNAATKLSERAMGKGCGFITDIIYHHHHPELRHVAISAKGLIKKSSLNR